MKTPIYLDFANGEVSEFSDADILDSGLPKSATVSTTNATVTTLATISLSNDCYGYLKVFLAGIETGGTKGITGGRFVHFKSSAGTASALSVVNFPADNLDGFTTATWTVDASGGNLRVRVTGEAATNIDWRCMYEIIKLEVTL